jgi:hypothetical protein
MCRADEIRPHQFELCVIRLNNCTTIPSLQQQNELNATEHFPPPETRVPGNWSRKDTLYGEGYSVTIWDPRCPGADENDPGGAPWIPLKQ